MAIANRVVLLTLFFSLIPRCLSRLDGAPLAACPDLTPQSPHSANAQTSPTPYNLTISGLMDTSIYIPGQTYTVTLGIIDPTSTESTPLFRGFLIQVRSANNNSILGGISSGGSNDVKLHACTPTDGGVTHTNNTDKSNISFQWTPTDMGNVLFRYTVVQTRDVYWVGTDTPVLQQAITDELTSSISPSSLVTVLTPSTSSTTVTEPTPSTAVTEPTPNTTGPSLRLSPEGPNYVIEQSREFELRCSFDGPSIMLSWIFVSNNSVVRTENDSSNIRLEFSNISASDAGLYVCTATNQFGISTNITANISVIAPNLTEPAVEVNLRVTVLFQFGDFAQNPELIAPLGTLINMFIPQSAAGVQISNCFLPNGCISPITAVNVSRIQCDVRSYPAINEVSNVSPAELRALVQMSIAMILQNTSPGIFQTNFTIDDPNVRPAAIVTSEQGEVINGVLELEYQRRRVLRCLPDQSSSQLIQNGSPVVGAWLVTEPGANINEEAISGFANTIANRSPCTASQVPRKKRQIIPIFGEEFPNTTVVFGNGMDMNQTCVVVGEFGFSFRIVTVSTISPSGPSMSAIFRFFASLSEPPTSGARLRRQINNLLAVTSSQILDLIPESDPGVQTVDCAVNQQAEINMNATALECNFTSFATTEPQFTQSVDTIMAALTNDSLPSVDILVETVSVAVGGFCPNETTNSVLFGNYTWPQTGGSQTVQLPCVFGRAVSGGPGGYAVRLCQPGQIWAPVNFSQCRDTLPNVVTRLVMPSPQLNPGFNIVVEEGRFVLISCAANSVGGGDTVAWYRIDSNGSEELVPPIDSIYSNFIDVNNPNNTDPANLARIDVLKALRPGVSLDSVQRLYTRTQEQTVFLTSQNLFKTSTSIGGQYVCRATNSIGVRSTTFNITVARGIGNFSAVYIRGTAQLPSLQFEGDLFFEFVVPTVLQFINSSSPGIETVSCSPATPRMDNLSALQVEIECVIREYPPVPRGILFVGTMLLDILIRGGGIVNGSERASVVGFCNAETIDGGTREVFRWNETEVNTNTSERCFYGPPDVVLTRTCLSPNNLTPTMIEICRTATSAEFMELQNVNVTQENVGTIVNNLTSIVASTNETVDQNTDSIRIVQMVIVQTASLLQSLAIPQEIVEVIVNNVVMILDSVDDWPPNVVEQESNEIVEAFDNIVDALIQQENFTNISVNTMDILLRAERIPSNMFQGRTFSVSNMQGNITVVDADQTTEVSASISIPQDIIDLFRGQDVRIAFTFYRESNLFPVTNTSANASAERTVVGSSVLGTQIAGIMDGMVLNSPVGLNFTLNSAGTPGENEIASPRCAFWDFSGEGFWSTRGCNLTFYNETSNEVRCECNHLTNFACLVDISARTTNPEPLPPSYRLALEIMSYVGVVLSLLGLIILFVTYLVFKKLRQKDVTKFHVQLALSMILMLIVFVAGISRTENRAGCITVGVLLHYLILVTWMWMAAEAVLLFQKLVIVFMKVSLKYIIILSIICWAAPIVPVVIPVAINSDYYITPPRNETGAPGFCFINHIGVFFGAFLGPIFLIILFNLVIFIIVITILVRHNISRNKRQMKDSKTQIPPKETCKLILSLSGIMTLLGLTWVLSVFTSVGASTNRDASFALQFLFVFFNSLQGFFLFVFFVILSSDARTAWLAVLCPCLKSSEPHTSKSHLRYTGNTSSTAKTNTYSSNIYSTTGTLEAAVNKDNLKMHSVAPIYEEDDEDDIDLPPLAPIDKKIEDKQSSTVNADEVGEKPKLQSEQSPVLGKQLRARVKRVSTKKRTHHVETAEFDFTDEFSDDEDFP